MLVWVVGREVRAHIYCCGRDSYNIFNAGVEGIDVEGRLFSELVRLIVGCNKGSSNVVLAEPVGSDLNLILFNHFDPG